MNENLIETVRALAKRMPIIKTCKPMPVSVRQEGFKLARPEDYDECDMRLVLAALERAGRIEKALDHIAHFTRFDPGYPMSYSKETAREIMVEIRIHARVALKEPQ